jgi:thiol-disulfide isomerase/thioredoxin
VSPGQPAPDFNIVGLDGKKYSLNDFKGKVIYLDFWASWCGPCMRELPFAKKIKQEYEGKDILFLYISIDDDAAAWKKAVASKDIKGVHLNDPDFSGKVGKAYNLVGIPSYFLIDKNGKIISNNPPRPSSEEELKKVLNAALVN